MQARAPSLELPACVQEGGTQQLAQVSGQEAKREARGSGVVSSDMSAESRCGSCLRAVGRLRASQGVLSERSQRAALQGACCLQPLGSRPGPPDADPGGRRHGLQRESAASAELGHERAGIPQVCTLSSRGPAGALRRPRKGQSFPGGARRGLCGCRCRPPRRAAEGTRLCPQAGDWVPGRGLGVLRLSGAAASCICSRILSGCPARCRPLPEGPWLTRAARASCGPLLFARSESPGGRKAAVS